MPRPRAATQPTAHQVDSAIPQLRKLREAFPDAAVLAVGAVRVEFGPHPAQPSPAKDAEADKWAETGLCT